MQKEKLSKILYALELDEASSPDERAAMLKRGGMGHHKKKDLAEKWQARMKNPKHKKRAEAIYKQYEENLAAIAGNAPKKASNTASVPPSLLKRAGSLVKALGSETKAIAQGQPTLTEQQVAARLALCEKCDQFKPNRTCGKCGCFMDAKARMRSQSCPIGKW